MPKSFGSAAGHGLDIRVHSSIRGYRSLEPRMKMNTNVGCDAFPFRESFLPAEAGLCEGWVVRFVACPAKPCKAGCSLVKNPRSLTPLAPGSRGCLWPRFGHPRSSAKSAVSLPSFSVNPSVHFECSVVKESLSLAAGRRAGRRAGCEKYVALPAKCAKFAASKVKPPLGTSDSFRGGSPTDS